MAISRKFIITISIHFIIIALISQTQSRPSIPNQNLNLQSQIQLHDHNPIFPIHPINDIHDLLPHYGLPIGLLPNNVDTYTISDDGSFKVFLTKACYVQFDDQLVYYAKVLNGKLKTGSVTDVSGIQAKKLFVWVPVTGMDSDAENGMIEFHVGILSEKLPAKQFSVVPVCKNKACLSSDARSQSQSF